MTLRDSTLRSFLQVLEDSRTPYELNRTDMEKYRPEMRKFYLNKSPRFN